MFQLEHLACGAIELQPPPWLTTKKHFVMLSLIIPGEKSVTGENMDTFLEPLL